MYKHQRSDEIFEIFNIKNGLSKLLYGDDFRLKDWETIESFYKNHKLYRIEVE